MLNGRLEGVIVHFGCCSILGTTEKNITDFINRTGCSFISGYQKDVDYITSSAFDLIYFELLQQYPSLRKIKSVIADRYSAFIERFKFMIK